MSADDVVATWAFRMDKGLQDPDATRLTFGKFEKPVAESKYIVRVKSKAAQLAQLPVLLRHVDLPAHVLKTVDGAAYLKDYNFKLLPGTGPYMSSEADVDKGKSVSIRRRTDYWAEKHRRNVGHEQLRRDPRNRRSRPESRVRDVQEGRPRLLLRQRLAASGSRS